MALQLHGMFENLGLQSFVKTSGSKGLQVYVPLNRPDVTFAQTKPFAKAVAELLEQAAARAGRLAHDQDRRAGKVLIDWSQNDRSKTTVCVYSLRAGERPTVSTPLEWDEVRDALDGGDRGRARVRGAEVLARVAERGDLFAPVLSLVQALPDYDAWFAYNAGMPSIQYTIRGVPPALDQELRREARATGKTLNSVVVETLEHVKLPSMAIVHDDLDWFVGSAPAASAISTPHRRGWTTFRPRRRAAGCSPHLACRFFTSTSKQHGCSARPPHC